MDDGFGSEFTLVPGYSSTPTYMISGLVQSTIYTFQYRSLNAVGPSAFSIQKRFQAILPPAKPAAPAKDMAQSSLTSVYLTWPAAS